MRTAAATAVAAKYLLPSGALNLAVVGYGNQAEAQIEALICVATIKRISIAGRNAQKAAAFVQKISQLYSPPRLQYPNVGTIQATLFYGEIVE